ncbi:hypothetical protein J6590_005127 [Homalodisca vitripennis]|nr:hypothetical protein J6590_005127 [Homalodisca vitripennis]
MSTLEQKQYSCDVTEAVAVSPVQAEYTNISGTETSDGVDNNDIYIRNYQQCQG